MALAAIVLLAASAAAQPFQPGTGFAPLGMQLLHLMRHRHGSTQCNIDMASQCNVLYLAIWHSCVCVTCNLYAWQHYTYCEEDESVRVTSSKLSQSRNRMSQYDVI